MNEQLVDIVFDILNGTRISQPGDPDVENMFAEGRECGELYDHIYDANIRLCQKLGIEEDPDVETIINAFLKITELMGKSMFRYGMELGKEL